jgi:hypothetical protein
MVWQWARCRGASGPGVVVPFGAQSGFRLRGVNGERWRSHRLQCCQLWWLLVCGSQYCVIMSSGCKGGGYSGNPAMLRCPFYLIGLSHCWGG